MYEQLIYNHSEYIPVWAYNLGAEFGKSREDVCRDWFNLNVKTVPDYPDIHRTNAKED